MLATSCAYFNTFYLARRYYMKGTAGLPYTVGKPDPQLAQNFPKAIDYSKKVLANYPKSKWVSPAYLLWARSLLGRDDPRETVNMLQDFDVRFPDSKLKDEALFYLGVGYGRSHRYTEAEAALDQYLARAPKSDLAPYAWLERSRALTSLDRDSAAAYCAGQVIDRFPKSKLGPEARAARAQALLESGDDSAARTDYQALGRLSRDDEERFGFLLKEADCLEAGHDYVTEMGLLKDALGHEQEPAAADTGRAAIQHQKPPGWDRYGRLLMRIGTVHLLAGRQKEAITAYEDVVRMYPKSQLSAEGEYRIGYAYETAGDDFTLARGEYMRVKDEFANSAFATQAQSRMTNLDRVTQFRSAGGDTVQKRAEAGLLLAELYLFQLGKPARALEEYGKVSAQFPGTPWAAKALNAQAWVMSRKLGRKAEADSLFWVVVHQYPATEGQLAARDYLEQDGAVVPDSLIQPPKEPETPPAPADTTPLTRPPTEPMPLGRLATADSVLRSRGGSASRRGRLGPEGRPGPAWDPRYAGSSSSAPSLAGDSPFTSPARENEAISDTTGGVVPAAPVPNIAAPRDSLRGGRPPGGPGPPRPVAPDTIATTPSRLSSGFGPPRPGSPDTTAAAPSRPPAPRADSSRIER
jgi:TolA-binding protein